MSATQSHVSLLGKPIANQKINAFFGIIGIYILGIFLTWYLTGIFQIPLPDDVPLKSLTTMILQGTCLCVIPYYWAMKRLNFSLKDLGISLNKLGISTLLGCLLYSIALVAFIHCTADPMISNHAIRWLDVDDASILLLAMSIGVATTDIATRGFILLSLTRYTNIPTAVVLQNIAWYAGHLGEIDQLTGCLSLWGAIGLTLTLGILGDIVALKTRNIVGLSIAHVLLNVTLTFYIRSL